MWWRTAVGELEATEAAAWTVVWSIKSGAQSTSTNLNNHKEFRQINLQFLVITLHTTAPWFWHHPSRFNRTHYTANIFFTEPLILVWDFESSARYTRYYAVFGMINFNSSHWQSSLQKDARAIMSSKFKFSRNHLATNIVSETAIYVAIFMNQSRIQTASKEHNYITSTVQCKTEQESSVNCYLMFH